MLVVAAIAVFLVWANVVTAHNVVNKITGNYDEHVQNQTTAAARILWVLIIVALFALAGGVSTTGLSLEHLQGNMNYIVTGEGAPVGR